MDESRELPVKPIGVVTSLAAGMDTVIQGWWVLLFPLALDIFLWFGPQLSVAPVVEKALTGLAPLVGEPALIEVIREAAERVNYFSALGVVLLGVPNVMSVKMPLQNPLGSPAVFAIESEWHWLLLFGLLTLGGLVLGSVYLGLIAQQVRDGRPALGRLARLLPRYWLSIMALLVFLLIVAGMLSIPVIIVAGLFSGISMWIATLVVWAGLMLFLWLVMHLFFAVHGILLGELSVFTASWVSLRLVAFNAFSVMGLVAAVLGISAGLNYVWSLPGENSWMMLMGIAGHAVISSGLVAATFVFYQDRYRYWRELRDYFAGVSQAT